MKPIEFEEANTVFAEDQAEYMSLVAFISPDDSYGRVFSCWKGTWKERVHFLLTGKMWLTLVTFKKLLQPSLLQVNSPFEEEK